jgi:hypothetical protein
MWRLGSLACSSRCHSKVTSRQFFRNILRFVLSYRMGNCVKHGLGTCSYQMRDFGVPRGPWHPNALASSSEGEERWA